MEYFKKIVLPLLLLIGLIFAFVYLFSQSGKLFINQLYLFPTPTLIPTPIKKEFQKAFVKRVIDGDTIELEDKKRIRYIGIDTPELHDPKKTVQCFAQEAYIKNKDLVEGKTVFLEKDISETDKYGRLLRYVYLENNNSTSEGLFINKYLVDEGFAYAATFPPDVKYSGIFVKAQEDAQKNQKGLWSSCRK